MAEAPGKPSYIFINEKNQVTKKVQKAATAEYVVDFIEKKTEHIRTYYYFQV